MRDPLRFMLEGSGEFEVAGYARDSEEAVVVWAVRNGLLGEWRHRLLPATLRRVRTAAKQLRRKLGYGPCPPRCPRC